MSNFVWMETFIVFFSLIDKRKKGDQKSSRILLKHTRQELARFQKPYELLDKNSYDVCIKNQFLGKKFFYHCQGNEVLAARGSTMCWRFAAT